MSDDIISRKVDLLFRKYGPVQNPSDTTSVSRHPAVRESEFRKDFLQEVQNAAMEIARVRRTEIE